MGVRIGIRNSADIDQMPVAEVFTDAVVSP